MPPKALDERNLDPIEEKSRESSRDSLDAWIADWTEHLALSRGLAESTIRVYRGRLVRLAEALGEVDPTAITLRDLDVHLRRLATAGMASSGISGAASTLRSFFAYLTDMRVIPHNPAIGLRGPKVYVKERPILTKPEIRRLIYVDVPADPMAARDVVVVSLAFVLGLRVSEAARLTLADVGTDEETGARWVRIRGAKHQTRDVRLWVHDAVVAEQLALFLLLRERRWPNAEALFPSRTGRALDPRDVGRIFKRRLGTVGIRRRGRPLSFHVLRHSLATHLLNAGADARKVQEVMRHKHMTTTEAYIHVRPTVASGVWRRHHPLRGKRGLPAGKVLEALRVEMGGLGRVAGGERPKNHHLGHSDQGVVESAPTQARRG